MTELGNGGPCEMEGLKKWKIWGNGGDLGKTDYLGKRRICGKCRNWRNGGPGKMEDLGKWRTWGNGGPGK
jgi:hypothetical protein